MVQTVSLLSMYWGGSLVAQPGCVIDLVLCGTVYGDTHYTDLLSGAHTVTTQEATIGDQNSPHLEVAGKISKN